MTARTAAPVTGADYTPRAHRGDSRTHHYLKRDLANPTCEYLIPWCQANAWFPDRHPRADIAIGPPWPGENYDPCPACNGEEQP